MTGVPFLPVGKMLTGWASHDLSTMAAEETLFRVPNGIVSTYTDFVNAPDFPTSYADAAVLRSSALLVAWEPWDWDAPINEQPDYAPRVIAAGEHDAFIEAWLTAAQAYATTIPVWVRFAPEMNDTQRPWSTGIGTIGYAEATPSEYIAMWRHVYGIKAAVAPDVQMMWNPLNYGASAYEFEDFYPGDDYVDMLALNGFNWSDVQETSPGWQDSSAVFGFTDLVNGPVNRLKTLADGKPWGIAEAASAPDNPTDFLPGGKYHDSYGSWVFDWPENPPYENTADDWITQHGWTEMLMRRSYNAGASFVALFHTNKETDWRLTDTSAGRNVMTAASEWNANIITTLRTEIQMPSITAGLVIDLNGSPEDPPEDRHGTTSVGFRRALAVLFKQAMPGVATPGRLGTDHLVVSGSPSAMEYTVSGGGVVLVRSSSNGAYLAGVPSSVTVPTDPSNGVNPRIDRIYVLQPDPLIDGAAVDVDLVIDVVCGTPAASPALPALPAGALELARKVIAPGATNTNDGAAFTNIAAVTGLNQASVTKPEARAQAGIFSGTGAPSPSLGEDGDIYDEIL